jgi:PAT family beta-lactamase induction signal transducer AmpG
MKSSPLRWVPTLFTIEGLGGILLWAVVPVMYKTITGESNTKINFWLSLMGIFVICRPLFMPFLEIKTSKKTVVIVAQFLMAIAFMLMALSIKTSHFFAISLGVVAFLTILIQVHDPCADGTYVEVLTLKDQNKYVGWMSAGYQIGKIVCQGGIILGTGVLISKFDFQPANAWIVSMSIVAGAMLLIAFYHYKVIPNTKVNENAKAVGASEIFKKSWEITADYFKKPGIWWCIAFFFFYRFAEEQAMSVFNLFLVDKDPVKGGLGLSLEQMGLAYGFLPPLALFGGAILAGYVMDKMGGFRKSILLFAIVYNVPLLVYGYIAYTLPHNLWLITVLCCVEYFGYGFGWNGLLVLNQNFAAPGKYKAAHLAIGTAIVHGASKIPIAASGYMSDLLGYKNFFLEYTVVMMIISVGVSFIVSRKLKEPVPIDLPPLTGQESF